MVYWWNRLYREPVPVRVIIPVNDNYRVDRVTDHQLADLFNLDDPGELLFIADDKRGMLFIQVCDGTWMKYQGGTHWTFRPDYD